MGTAAGSTRRVTASPARYPTLTEAARWPSDRVLAALGTSADGLGSEEAAQRLARIGPNAVRDRRTRAWTLLGRQVRSPLLILLTVTAAVSFFLAERADAMIIGVILVASVGLGFANEYRAERASQALHNRVRTTAVTIRDRHAGRTGVLNLVPGDVVRLTMGAIVPADVRLLAASNLTCNESVLTGESTPTAKNTDPITEFSGANALTCCALMGTVVTGGTGTGVVVATGPRAEFGRIAVGLDTQEPETEFQRGLRRFSTLLMQVAAVLTGFILLTNLLLHRTLLDALLFSLAIAVGITPQLLPAVVSTSLATGSRRLAAVRVLVKRLVCIEDLGDLDVLVTDKTGTLTNGQVTFEASLDDTGRPDNRALTYGLLAADVDLDDAGEPVGGNDLDLALARAAVGSADPVAGYRRIAALPFDHDRQLASVLVTDASGDSLLIVKGAPEAVLGRCRGADQARVRDLVGGLFRRGARVIAVAVKPAPGRHHLVPDDEANLDLVGFLTLRDLPKDDAADALRRLAGLGVTVKLATGDNPLVAETVCRELGVDVRATLTGDRVAG